jgi:predicted DCC family thiol-disulfide oxidoreductase YuxK
MIEFDSGSVAPGGMMEAWTITVLYDGECPLCTREVEMLRRRDPEGRAARFEDIAAPGFDAARYGRSQAELMARIHGVLPDGTLVDGVEVFRRVYAAVGLGWLVAPTGWPLLRPLFDAAYRWFARNRLRLTGRDEVCDAHACTRPARDEARREGRAVVR